MPVQGSADSEVSRVPAARDEAVGLGLDPSVRASAEAGSAAKSAAKPGKTMGQRGPAGSMKSPDLNSAAPVWRILEHV